MSKQLLLAEKHILILEDNAEIRELIDFFLSDQGATTHIAADGEEGLKQAIACSHLDLIVSDIRMPNMSGPDAVKAIRAQCGPVPVVFIDDASRYQADIADFTRACCSPNPLPRRSCSWPWPRPLIFDQTHPSSGSTVIGAFPHVSPS